MRTWARGSSGDLERRRRKMTKRYEVRERLQQADNTRRYDVWDFKLERNIYSHMSRSEAERVAKTFNEIEEGDHE